MSFFRHLIPGLHSAIKIRSPLLATARQGPKLTAAAQILVPKPALFYLTSRGMSSDAGKLFEEAQAKLKTLQKDPGNQAKLKLYALFKQATVGPVNVKRPGMLDMVGRAKWDAWNELGQMTQAEAQQEYHKYVTELAGEDAPPAKTSEQSTADSNGLKQYEGFHIYMDGKLRVIKLNRPAKKNAINRDMYQAFAEALKEAEQDPNTVAVAVTGEGDYFCSGNDLSGMMQFSGSLEDAAKNGRDILLKFVASIIDFNKVLFGVVNGPAVGISVTILGLMDAVYASDRATFHTPFSILGQSPEACSSYTFPRIMGPARANSMLLLNKKITAAEAHTLGLVTEVFPDHSFQSEVWKRLREYSELPPKSLNLSKQLIRGFDKKTLHQVNEAECDLLCERWQSEECISAIMKFATKSKL